MTVAALTLPATSPRVAPTSPRLMKLEAIRGFAAAYVFMSHAPLTPSGRSLRLFSFGQEAVILFFILSGFVIHHTTCDVRGRESFRNYFLRRFRRIYPLFVFALFWSYAVLCLVEGRLVPFPGLEFAGNLLMLQDLRWVKRGTWVGPFRGNSPLWSLSYEWWFYMLFYPLVYLVRVRDDRQKYLVFAVALASFVLYQAVPNQVSLWLIYFPIWWSGVDLSREFGRTGRITWRGQAPTLALLATLAAAWLVPAFIDWQRGERLHSGFEPILPLRHFTAALAFLVVGIAWSRRRFVGFSWTLGPFQTLAPISYAIYVLHDPPLYQLNLHVRGDARLALTVVIGVGLLALGYLLEVRVQGKINRLTNRWLRNGPEKPRIYPQMNAD